MVPDMVVSDHNLDKNDNANEPDILEHLQRGLQMPSLPLESHYSRWQYLGLEPNLATMYKLYPE
jgi:hypothetical protein